MKEIFINSYTKKDGTHVREHYRTIEGSAGQYPEINYDNTPVLTGGVSVDVIPEADAQSNSSVEWGDILANAGIFINAIAEIGSALGEAANTTGQKAVNSLKIKPAIQKLENTHKLMKQDLDRNLQKLTQAPNQNEYSALYNKFVKQYDTYKRASNSIVRIKNASENQDYDMVLNELERIKSSAKSYSQLKPKSIDFRSVQPAAKYKDELKNFAPVPSPFSANYYVGNIIPNSPREMKHIIDTTSFLNKVTGKNFIDDGTEFWNGAVNNLNTEYIRNNGVTIDNVYSIPSNRLKLEVAQKLNSQKLNVENTRGVVFYKDSEVSDKIAKSGKFQEFVRSNKKALLNEQVVAKGSINYPLKNINLWSAIGKADIIDTYIDKDGNLISTVIDTYEFNAHDMRIPVKMGRAVQDAKLLEPFFSVILISIPINIWIKWI